jgi:hypothetical protein
MLKHFSVLFEKKRLTAPSPQTQAEQIVRGAPGQSEGNRGRQRSRIRDGGCGN